MARIFRQESTPEFSKGSGITMRFSMRQLGLSPRKLGLSTRQLLRALGAGAIDAHLDGVITNFENAIEALRSTLKRLPKKFLG